MMSSRTGLTRRSSGRRRSILAGMAILGLVASTGCQVEYAGMTLPSGKYMQDDVQYFAPGPEFPYANTQAATQRARMATHGDARPAPGHLPGPWRRWPPGPWRDARASPRLAAALCPVRRPRLKIENAMPGGSRRPESDPARGDPARRDSRRRRPRSPEFNSRLTVPETSPKNRIREASLRARFTDRATDPGQTSGPGFACRRS